MPKIRTWTSPTTGRSFKYPVKAISMKVLNTAKEGSCCRLDKQKIENIDLCPTLFCHECVYSIGTLNENELLEFSSEIYTPRSAVKREIRYKETSRSSTHISIQITHQPYVGREFSICTTRFRGLYSAGSPFVYRVKRSGEIVFFVRGILSDNDNNVLHIPIDKYYQFAFDVYLYNKTEGGYKEIKG